MLSKAPFLACYVLNFWISAIFPGKRFYLTIYWSFKDISPSEKMPLKFLIGEVSKLNQIALLTVDWPAGRFFRLKLR